MLIIGCILWETYFRAKWVNGNRLDGPTWIIQMMQFTETLWRHPFGLHIEGSYSILYAQHNFDIWCVSCYLYFCEVAFKNSFWSQVRIGQCSSASAEEAYREGNLKNIKPTGKEITRTEWQKVRLLTINKKINLRLALAHRNLYCVCC